MVIKLQNLAKSFNNNKVLNDISLKLKENTCTALIGKNGAGKTTLIDILIGNIQSDVGHIVDESKMIDTNHMGVLYQKTNFPKLFKVKELFHLHQSFYKNPISLPQFINITQFNNKQMNQMTSQLSGGQKRILDLALTLVGQPEFLILDEPTSGMDIETREHFWSIIEKLKQAHVTILYTSHYIEEVERMADQVVLLDQGQIQLDDSPEHIKNTQNNSIIVLPILDEGLFNDLKNAFNIKKLKNHYEIKTNQVEAVIQKLIEYKFDLNKIEIHKLSLLEIVFSGIENQKGVMTEC